MTLDNTDRTPLQKIGGWKRLSTRTVYENPWISVHHEEVKTPSGSDGIYGLVHFKGRAIGVVPVDDQHNTWLVKQSRYTLNEFTWEIPEGGSGPNEDPLDCAKRELEEECGLRASRWRQLLTLHTTNSVSDEVGYIFLAQGLTAGQQQLDASEDIEVKKLPLTEAVRMVLSGEITDALSVAALLRVALEWKLELS